MRFIVTIALLALFAAVALSQRHGGADSVQNYGREIEQSSNPDAKTKQSFPRPNWMVKYASGSLGVNSDRWLRVAFVPRAALADIATPIVAVPADQLVTIEFSAKTEKNSHLMQGPRSGCSYAHGLMPDTAKNPRPEVAVAIALSPGPVSRLAERLNVKHPVRFIWNEAGEQKSLIVKVTDCEYRSFIANVEWFVGARWPEVRHDSGR
jgi:hypothetical protein